MVKDTSKHMISKTILKEMKDYFVVDNCPICDSVLIKTIKSQTDNEIKCKNDCYEIYIGPLSTNIKLDIVWEVLIFNHYFGIYEIMDFTDYERSKNHVFLDARYYYSIKKSVENLIRYYKYNDRYIMKMLMLMR